MTITEIKKLKRPKEIKDWAIKRRREELAELKERRKRGLCCAVWHHGPGHQSSTFCQEKGKHTIHSCVYGSYDQYAEWRNKECCSGYFDEPKLIGGDT